MEKNKALVLAAAVFGIIALVHLSRAVFRWSAVVSGVAIPVYASYLAALILGYLAWQMHEASKV